MGSRALPDTHPPCRNDDMKAIRTRRNAFGESKGNEGPSFRRTLCFAAELDVFHKAWLFVA
jgi:hypothetical protein